jgi:hypothetical protein
MPKKIDHKPKLAFHSTSQKTTVKETLFFYPSQEGTLTSLCMFCMI